MLVNIGRAERRRGKWRGGFRRGRYLGEKMRENMLQKYQRQLRENLMVCGKYNFGHNSVSRSYRISTTIQVCAPKSRS